MRSLLLTFAIWFSLAQAARADDLLWNNGQTQFGGYESYEQSPTEIAMGADDFDLKQPARIKTISADFCSYSQPEYLSLTWRVFEATSRGPGVELAGGDRLDFTWEYMGICEYCDCFTVTFGSALDLTLPKGKYFLSIRMLGGDSYWFITTGIRGSQGCYFSEYQGWPHWTRLDDVFGTRADFSFRLYGEKMILGDMNCDAQIDFDDLDGFVLALTDPERYRSIYPFCGAFLADIDEDGAVDFNDIDGFVDCLINNGCE